MGKRRGGFGKLVRIVGRELAERGFDVNVIAWDEERRQRVLELDGMTIYTYPYTWTSGSTLRHLRDYTKVVPLIKRVAADVYISIDCMIETLVAEKIMPNAKHIIWVQDPFDDEDYKLLGSVDPNYRLNRLKFWATKKLCAEAFRSADIVAVQARYYISKIERLYGVNRERVLYLPNPVEYVPNEADIAKSSVPLVCFLGRMDPQKRYWLFFQLAKTFPDIKFIAMGRPGVLYVDLYKRIAPRYENLENLKIMGFVSEEQKSKILSRCWILTLPSIREGLPIAFLEALAHKCSLLSSVNPDGLVDRYGYWARDADFVNGLMWLLEGNRWYVLGEEGYKYVSENHRLDIIVSKLEGILEDLADR